MEGRVRVIPRVEDGDQLQDGEILVTTVTNVGWTPMFPRDTSNLQPLFREERTIADPKFCEGFEILLVSTRNCVFPPTFNAETTLSRRVRLDIQHNVVFTSADRWIRMNPYGFSFSATLEIDSRRR